ncbi:hypothetical protein C8R45DRAFT_1100012 [Mycena sanguinolenta]|nr:hypothetical protein C8R45DRAFT_1100012 [Mycena sanguinolenta]
MDAWGEDLSALTELPNLTHLTFDSAEHVPTCLDFLLASQSLRVMVILLFGDTHTDLLDWYGIPQLAREVRFLVIVCANHLQDFVHGAHFGRNYWSVAEEVIAKRRSGAVDALNYYVSYSSYLDQL